jgi:small-conductance mechanosensitive channel
MPAIDQVPSTVREIIRHGLVLLTICAGAWLAIGLVGAVATFLRSQYPVDVADNLRAREIQTRLDVLHRCLVIVIAIVASAVALMTFPAVRQVGATLLASAGIAGLAIGLAARPVLENLIAGLQLALTQPIRLDDVVIVEGEWGRIEEITTTYVVVRIWDDRRLIVPIARFIDQPFQNWTRRTADLVGSVFLFTDYNVPVDRVREALQEIVRSEPLWDGRVCVLQVTDATERALQLRALVSASDASRAWDLRVAVREKLVAFLQRELPDCLPKLRVDAGAEEDRAGEHGAPS